jgi:hypothetical protein
MEAELKALEAALGSPERPVVAVVGGAKVSTKIDLLANLVTKVDHLVIGGGMANTFLVAEGIEVGKSLAERDMAETAREIRHRAQKAGCRSTCRWIWSWRASSRRGRKARPWRPRMPAGCDDPGCGAGDGGGRGSGVRIGQDADLERPAGCLRDRAVQRGDRMRRHRRRRG